MEKRSAMTASLSVVHKKNDKWIPWYFVFFFLVVALVDGILVTISIRTQTGLVTERAYEKGLAYDKILDEAAAQENLGVVQKAEYKNGVLSWRMADKNGGVFGHAKVSAHFFRPTQGGYDFDMELEKTGDMLFEAQPRFPLPGAWTARLEAEWQDSHSQIMRYDTKLELIAP